MRLPSCLLPIVLVASCGGSDDSPGSSSSDGGAESSTDGASEAALDAAADAPFDGGTDVPTARSAFGIFAAFTREFTPYEQAAGLTHDAYLAWAGEQYEELGAHWTRSNLQLMWDLVEPIPGGAYDWFNVMGTEECFSAAGAAGVHYLAVFHEGGVLDPELRNQLEDPEGYQRFVRDVVERYDGDGVEDAPGGIRITHWQVGNETPQIANLPNGAGDYVAWFTLTAEAVRQADPTARMVLVGSTDSSVVDSLHASVIPALASAGVRFDAVDIHHWGGADEVEIHAAADYRSLLDSHGLEDVELWSMEHGTHVGTVTIPDAQCSPACPAAQVCVQIGPTAKCVPRCASDAQCPPAVPLCDTDSGICNQPAQSLEQQARSLVQRYVVNRDAGVSLILWNNLVAWHEFGGQFGGVYDRMGLVSGGFLEFETAADRGKPRPAWFAYRLLASKTDETRAERLGPVDLPGGYASAYRNRETGVVGWVAWSNGGTISFEQQIAAPSVRVTGFVTNESGIPLREETVPAEDGAFAVAVDANPVWLEPSP
jgi:hypothetical protein